MIEGVGDSLPAIIATAIAMIAMSGLTLLVAKKSGVSDITAAASRESERLVEAQAKRIKLLERQMADLLVEREKDRAALKKANQRIDDLEKLISDEQLRRLDRSR